MGLIAVQSPTLQVPRWVPYWNPRTFPEVCIYTNNGSSYDRSLSEHPEAHHALCSSFPETYKIRYLEMALVSIIDDLEGSKLPK